MSFEIRSPGTYISSRRQAPWTTRTVKVLEKLGHLGPEPRRVRRRWRAAARTSGWSRRWTAAPWPRWPTWTGRSFERILDRCHRAFADWRLVPAPKRGEVVKELGDELRRNKEALAELVTLEMGKTLREGLGEVQEMIDICDFAVGLSRQLYGRTMPSERRLHRLQEQWQPLGVVGVITAFNFPVAVWAWNTAIALVCGDTGPVEALQQDPALRRRLHPHRRAGAAQGRPRPGRLQPGRRQGQRDRRPGQHRPAGGPGVLHRLACRGPARGPAGAGAVRPAHPGAGRQRRGHRQPGPTWTSPCPRYTSAPSAPPASAAPPPGRVIIHESIYDTFVARLQGLYARTRIGDPRDGQNLMGPLVDQGAVAHPGGGHRDHQGPGRRILCGGEAAADARRVLRDPPPGRGAGRPAHVPGGDLRARCST